MTLDEGRSATEPVTESFSSAPTCSWDARMVRRILRANQMPAAKKANCARRLPSAYQLLWIQVNSFMGAPWTGAALIYNLAQAGETGSKSRKRTGGSSGLAVYATVRETAAARSGPSFLPGFRTEARVLQGDHAFQKGLVFEQGKLALRKAGREEREALADEDRNDADIEFVDEVVFEEVAHEFAAAHQPDVFSGALAQLLDESFRGFVDEGYAGACAGRLGMGENVGLETRVVVGTSAHFESDIVRLAAHDRGINGGEKWTHRIVLGHEEKIDRTIGAGDVTVETDAQAQDDLAH